MIGVLRIRKCSSAEGPRVAERKWKRNSGKHVSAKNPNKMVYLRFRTGYETPNKVRAGGYIWSHRGWNFDIMEASDDD